MININARSKHKQPVFLPEKYFFMGKDHKKARTLHASLQRSLRRYVMTGKEELQKRKPNGSLVYLGCSLRAWKAHIEESMCAEMTWENYGSVWKIKYVKPLKDFDMREEEQVKQAFHFKNTSAEYPGGGRPVKTGVFHVKNDDGSFTTFKEAKEGESYADQYARGMGLL